MRPRFLGYSVIAVAAAAAVCLVPMRAAAQEEAPARNGNRAPSAPSGPTPRTADGHPDLNGVWSPGTAGGGTLSSDSTGNVLVYLSARGGSGVNFERDGTLMARRDPNKPLYKPEFWEKVQNLDQNRNALDPTFSCMPDGVPRMGPPSKIVQTPTEMIFLYLSHNTFRVIPTDGRPHLPEDALEGTWNGDSIGRWEGDTLVVDTIGFNDVSWFGTPGYFHSDQMHAIERIHREGNTLTWQATVEDPGVLLKPFAMNSRTVRLNPNPRAELEEDLPCSERDLSHIVTKEHH